MSSFVLLGDEVFVFWKLFMKIKEVNFVFIVCESINEIEIFSCL